MSLLRYYARAAGDPRLVSSVAATLRAEWDPAAEAVISPKRSSA